ncbi:MAG TPA: heavy metal translocating P-type ATPase [Kofleriaceae bacterium]|nr:heavy metal translocating P-type ATPase [Kofleriaceae bacterium]
MTAAAATFELGAGTGTGTAAARAGCLHCGLPVPAAAASRYCCAGCEVVHAALTEHGLDGYYRLAGDELAPARTTGKSYRELDDPAFHALHVRLRADGLAETALYLEEVRCTACVWLVERTPTLLDGVVELRLDFGRARADVVFDPAQVKLSAIAGLLDRLGHPVHPYRGLDRDAARRREDRALMLKIGVAGAAAGNIMLLAIALYAGIFGGMGTRDQAFFRWTSMLVALPALSFAATPFFRGALGALRSRRLHLDLPIAIGIAAGLGWGAANTVRGVGEIYFDSLAMLVFLLLIGRWVQSRQHRRAVASAELLYTLTPRVTRRFDPARPDAEPQEVPLEAVSVGERVLVRAGDTVPVDGEVVRGRSAVDAGLLTGESRPVDVEPGMRVHAGTVNVAGVLEVVASATGEATRVGQLVARIEDEARRRAPIQRFVDRVAGRFVAVVLGIAALTLAAWSLHASVGVGLERAMALLIVTCPCALALATPLAVTVALGRAARRGLLIKGGDALERLARPGRLYLDKTGTLTEGAIRLVGWDGEAAARPLAAALEAGSAHPLARALCAELAAERDAAGAVTADELAEELGHGLRGRVDGRAVAVGSPRWVTSFATLPSPLAAAIDRAAAAGETPVAVAVDGTVVAIARFADRLRPDAAASIAHLRAAGWDVRILSGDDPRIVRGVGAALGLAPDACEGGVTPEGKLAAVRDARAHGPVVMVGDGVNDAAALAAATCGVAVHGSAEASVDAADVFVRRPGLAPLVELFDGARATLAVIRRNLRVSLAYNLTGGTLAVSGLIHPLIAAVMMPLSSLSVLFSSSRTRGFRPPEET